jgi:drug/metabolite transporter (DMT)-like permease
MTKLQAHIFAFLTPILAAYSQLIIKWQVLAAGQVPDGYLSKITFIVNILLKPWVLSALLATFLSGVTWMMAMTRLELSHAYPFVALTFIVVPLCGIWLFDETLTTAKVIGSVIILVGIAVVTLGDR